MASAWGISWGAYWGNSWGFVTAPTETPTGGGTSGKRRRRGWANERARLEASLVKTPIIKLPEVAKVREYDVAEFDNSAIIAEIKQLERDIAYKELEYAAGRIAKEEYERFVAEESDALHVLLLALELDRHVLLSII